MKLKSLAAESRIIRAEERKQRHPSLRNGLTTHRREVVRAAARNTALAYGFIRGRAYRDIEAKGGTPPNVKEVERMVKQYGLQWDFTGNYTQFSLEKAEENARLSKWFVV